MKNSTLEQQKWQLIEKAEKLFGKIHPCLNKPTLDDCFTLTKDRELFFWFNTEDNSTHLVAMSDVAVYDIVTLEKLKKRMGGFPDKE